MLSTLPFLPAQPEASQIYAAAYSPHWVVISVLLAFLASYAALRAAQRISRVHDLTSRLTWISISSLTIGIGIWAMHFIGMLALILPCEIYYDPWITLISMVPGIMAGGIALGVGWGHDKKYLHPMLAAILLGLGIGTMHYTGMAAMRLGGFIRYNPAWFALSIVVAVALSYAALAIRNHLDISKKRNAVLVAAVLGAAVSAMHYTAMAATYFMRGNAGLLPSSAMSSNMLAALVAVTTVVLALASLAFAAISRNQEITEALRVSEERSRLALKASRQGWFDLDVTTGMSTVDPIIATLLGYDNTDDLNPSLQEFQNSLHPDDRDMVLAALKQCIVHGDPVPVEYRRRKKNGDWIWFHTVGEVSLRDSQNKALRITGVHTDITERKSIENMVHAQQESMRQMLEISPIAVRVAAAAGRKVLFANQRYATLINCDPSSMVGVDPKPYYANPKDYEEIITQVGEGRTIIDKSVELCIPGKGAIWAMASYMPIDYLGEPAILGWFYDVTELRKAKDFAERLARTKSEFLANMSHEIRTPMNGVIGLTELALNKASNPELRDYLDKISTSSQSLLLILNDILDFSKLEAGHMTIEHTPFDLDMVLDHLRTLFEERAQSKSLGFAITVADGTPRDLVGDAMRLQQILANLLGNAIKFTAQGYVALKVEIKQREGAQTLLTFTVKDTGIGMSAHDQTKLFQPFSQADGSITRRFGGTGLGLAISHDLLKLMGGEFHIKSQPNQGTTFSFDLMLGISTHAKASETRHRGTHEAGQLEQDLQKSATSLKGARILVAEDNRINQQVVKEFLKLSGMAVTIANNGQEALDLLKTQSFDAILMDMQMPVMDGVEATKTIRSNPDYANLPIIALTAGVTQEERDSCTLSGMNDFVPKPVNPKMLIATLARWVTVTA